MHQWTFCSNVYKSFKPFVLPRRRSAWNTIFMRFWGEFRFMLFSNFFTSTSSCKERPSFPVVWFIFDILTYHDTLVVYAIVFLIYLLFLCGPPVHRSNIYFFLFFACICGAVYSLKLISNLKRWHRDWSTSMGVWVSLECDAMFDWILCDSCSLALRLCSFVAMSLASCNVPCCSL